MEPVSLQSHSPHSAPPPPPRPLLISERCFPFNEISAAVNRAIIVFGWSKRRFSRGRSNIGRRDGHYLHQTSDLVILLALPQSCPANPHDPSAPLLLHHSSIPASHLRDWKSYSEPRFLVFFIRHVLSGGEPSQRENISKYRVSRAH